MTPIPTCLNIYALCSGVFRGIRPIDRKTQSRPSDKLGKRGMIPFVKVLETADMKYTPSRNPRYVSAAENKCKQTSYVKILAILLNFNEKIICFWRSEGWYRIVHGSPVDNTGLN